MINYYIFNGDADGLCATVQLLQAETAEAETATPEYITGVKRDISLLEKIDHLQAANITVMDIAVEKNLQPLNLLLEQGCRIRWFDHHVSEDLPGHKGFEPHINTSPEINTSLLVAQYLGDPDSAWAIVGLFGDNSPEPALAISRRLNLSEADIGKLRELGELLNYNAYGESIDDLHFHPVDVLEKMRSHLDPFTFCEKEAVFSTLKKGFQADMGLADAADRLTDGIVCFPAEKWARRVIGVFANSLAREEPEKAHAILVENADRDLVVSVRAAVTGDKSAAVFCKQFPTGGGRTKAAGINLLPKAQLPDFIQKFETYFC